MMNHNGDDPITLFSQFYPEMYSETVPHQGEEGLKRRRRRKKNRGVNDNNGGMLKKRKLSEEQVKLLEMNFKDEQKLESKRKDTLASELGLDPRQVAVWFQNRRARWKNKKLEEEYDKLRNSHDTLLLDRSQLESQVLQLTQLLSEKEREIQKLTERSKGESTHSPSSSLSIEAATETTPLYGDFGVSNVFDDDLFYPSDNSYMMNYMEYIKFYM